MKSSVFGVKPHEKKFGCFAEWRHHRRPCLSTSPAFWFISKFSSTLGSSYLGLSCEKDIRQLDFSALYQAGYRGAVFDKDNCLTIPHRDTIVPELEEAWRQCRETFGDGNVVIVSNMAGTSHDAGQLEAESVTYHLGVPVLRHRSPKPSYSCITTIRRYFGSLRVPLRDNELIIVGDRILTDIVMANRMHRKSNVLPLPGKSDDKVSHEQHIRSLSGPLAVWTTGLWERENMLLRWWENRLVNMASRWPCHSEDGGRLNYARFVKTM